MASLAGINIGPTIDWMHDNGRYKHFLIWKAQVCSEISLPHANILDNFNSDFNFDLIPTLNVPIYKFQYQSMFCLIIKQITIC